MFQVRRIYACFYNVHACCDYKLHKYYVVFHKLDNLKVSNILQRASVVIRMMMTKSLIRLLLPACSNTATSEPSSLKSYSLHSPFLTSMQARTMAHIVRPSSLLSKPTHTVHYYWRKVDDALMRPMFGGHVFVPFSPGSPTEQSVHVGR
mgnify:CR=1 FL=1